MKSRAFAIQMSLEKSALWVQHVLICYMNGHPAGLSASTHALLGTLEDPRFCDEQLGLSFR